MIDCLAALPPQELLACVSQEIEHRQVQDHINFKQYKPNAKQLAFHATGLIAKERAFFAGNRCGKSWAVSAEGCMHLTGNYTKEWNGYRYSKPINMWAGGVADKELKQLKQYYVGYSTKQEPGFIHPSLIVKKNEQEHSYHIRHVSGGISTLRFKTYKQGEGAWQAETVDLIHLDEEPPHKIYTEAITRTLSTSPDHYGMVMASLTPLRGVTLFMLQYMQKIICDDKGEEVGAQSVAPEEVNNSRVYILSSHDDSPHLSDEEKKRILAAYSPHEREARTKGIPSLGSGLVYPVLESKFVVSPFEIPEYWPRCFGFDLGWHNTAALFMAHDRDNDVVYLYGEYLAGHMTPDKHSVELHKQGANWMPCAYDWSGESAGPIDGANVIDLYRENGIRNLIRADKRSVEKGVITVLQRMESDKLKIFSTLRKTLTELRMYARDDNGQVKKGNDHLMDAMRYGIVTGLPIASVKPSVMKSLRIPVHNNSGGSWMRL